MTKTYRFADVNVRVTAIHSAVLSFCSGYETDGDADFAVSISQQDIAFERSRADHPGYSDAYLETLSLIDRLNVKLYRLGCNMEKEAAEVSYNAMKED